jgi:hypothetical protein
MRLSLRGHAVLFPACVILLTGCGGGTATDSVAVEKVQAKFDRARQESAKLKAAAPAGRSNLSGPVNKKKMDRR